MVSHTCIMFLLTQCTIHEYKAGNDVSEFMHSKLDYTVLLFKSYTQESDS